MLTPPEEPLNLKPSCLYNVRNSKLTIMIMIQKELRGCLTNTHHKLVGEIHPTRQDKKANVQSAQGALSH
jgi:hypothetical protein